LFGGEFILVKIIDRSGAEQRFDSKDVKKDLEAAGLPERVAEEVAERVEDRVGDGWTTAKVREQTDIELNRLEEDIQRAHKAYDGEPKGTTSDMTERTGYAANKPETFVPETERERHGI
jgi:hypothetical protein